MSSVQPEQPGRTLPASRTSELYDDDIDATSISSALESLNGRFSSTPSDKRSVYSYTSSVDREFILKDLYGRVVNNTNEVITIFASGWTH